MIVISKIIQSTKEFVKVLGFGVKGVNTPVQCLPFGIDSKPIKDKRGVVVKTMSKSNSVLLGVLLQSDKTESGEIRHYALDDDGVEKFYIHLKKDGTCEVGGNVDNLVRYSKLATAFNELKSDFNSLVSAFNSHMHATAATGPPVAPTPVPSVVPATPSIADISGAKIDEVKTL